MKESFVAADENYASHGTISLMPPFFLPVFGCRSTPLKMVLENSASVVESMIRSCFIHSSVSPRRAVLWKNVFVIVIQVPIHFFKELL